MCEYVKTVLKEDFIVKRIISVHYFEYDKNFIYEGESHDFWEFVYIDRGEAFIRADDKWFKLSAGEITFHKPNEFHNIKANGIVAPNSVIVAFECHSRHMKFFENKILRVGDNERHLLATIINEAINAFSSPLGDVTLKKLERREQCPVGSEQIIKLSLEMLLIALFRAKGSKIFKRSGTLKERTEKDIVSDAIEYMNKNISENVTFKEISEYVKAGGTTLKNAFRQRTGESVMNYFRKMKTDYAKILIREGNYNFTQIAEKLGYDGVDKFSRQFKAVAGMSPTEYSRSVKMELKQ